MEIDVKLQLEKDFETCMHSYFNEFKRFSLEDFSAFSATILNYYINNHIIDQVQKQSAAYYLTTLYNKGIGNRIIEEHLQLISQNIAADFSVDFNVVKRLFA